MEGGYKRVNVMIGEEQYRILSEQGLNVSGLIRDLIGDHLSENVITLQVSEETRHIYDTVISNTGSDDQELESHLRVALASLLEEKISDMRALHQRLVDEGKNPEE